MKRNFLNQFFLLTAFSLSAGHGAEAQIGQVKHIVIIYMENHSFDNLWGGFPGADGLANAKNKNVIQLDLTAKPYPTLPPVPLSSVFPGNLPNSFFNIDHYVSPDQVSSGVTHLFYQEQLQIDGGKMDKYVLYNQTKGFTMGFYNTARLPLYELARKYTLCDRFFHSAFGGSFLNHQWLIAAATPVFATPPDEIRATLDADGNLVKDGCVTPDGFAVNTLSSVNLHPDGADPAKLLPVQAGPTIGDRLSDKGIS